MSQKSTQKEKVQENKTEKEKETTTKSNKAKTKKTGQFSKHLVCGICGELFYQTVIITKCLHCFCGGCLSTYFQENDNEECPICNVSDLQVKNFELLDNLVRDFLLENPEKERKKEILEELNKKNGFLDENKNNKEETEKKKKKKKKKIEKKGQSKTKNSCSICSLSGNQIQPIKEYNLTKLPKSLFSYNKFERGVLVKYLEDQDFSFQDMWEQIMKALENGAYSSTDAPNFHNLSPNDKSCESCLEGVVSELIYSYRTNIPNSELPPKITKRQNCWYGRNCRTQKKYDHSSKLNHICEQTKK
ncbi:ubiquitin ligase protein chfr [Anaeramoeba flamelloides]|uniref:Ubiquitin ligase protein chfr n=1 Tax=Anaeramoeba flamelloides TaxID=1746091 RepID=A0ABQ8X284_9EUKA|nr:ubiquitin ligase protein chfr [Anaeramoeba flamelloides]